MPRRTKVWWSALTKNERSLVAEHESDRSCGGKDATREEPNPFTGEAGCGRCFRCDTYAELIDKADKAVEAGKNNE